MKGLVKGFLLFGLGGILILQALLPQQGPESRAHGTGLIPMDSREIGEIIKEWPRVRRVNLNRLGWARINEVRAKKGKARLSSIEIRPVGQELESSLFSANQLAPEADLVALPFSDRPAFVDNSILPYFPPIRSQGMIGSCAAFSTTYTQLSYMTAFQRDVDIRDDADDTNKYSPKWTYNMVNGGADNGSTFLSNYRLLERHGACTWAEFPYDSDFRSWLLNPSAWRSALSARTKETQYVYSVSTDEGLALTKDLLANGYVLVLGTYMYSWQHKTIQDDPSTLDDDGQAGKSICYWVNGYAGAHAMVIVGYNDAIWTDINSDGFIDAGEKGAFRIANSWGSGWGDEGFTWLAYDALKATSVVPDGPYSGRVPALQNDMLYILTARDNYSPLMVGEFTINHAKRGQLGLMYGFSDTTETSPTSTWTPWALNYQGGAYAFDGSTIPVDGTFVYDFTDTLNVSGLLRRYYLGLTDSTYGDTATLSAFRILDLSTDPAIEVVSSMVPQAVDGGTTYAYLDYVYSGSTNNHDPVLSSGSVSPPSGTASTMFSFQVSYDDWDPDSPSSISVYIDGVSYPMSLVSGLPFEGSYVYQTLLSAGTHSYWFSASDGRGGMAREPIVADFAGPIVGMTHLVTPANTPTGESIPAAGIPYSYGTGGSLCNQGHLVQYRFNWGDGTFSDWLDVGQTSTPHSWSPGVRYHVSAQARCAVDTVIVSSWSEPLAIVCPQGMPFVEDFSSAGFPAGWSRESFGSGIMDKWNVSETVHAGGQPNEMVCQYQNVNPGVTRLITPPIDTRGLSSVWLTFRHMLNTYDVGGTQIKVQSSSNGANWTDEGWSVTTSTSDVGPDVINVQITNNVGIPTTYIALVIMGDLWMFDLWAIDNISITASPGIPFSESFSGPSFPSGWSQINIGNGISELWGLSASNYAGGLVNEMLCSWQNIPDGRSRLITPALDTTGYSSLRLRFRHFLDSYYSGGVVLRVLTSGDGLLWQSEGWQVTTTEANIGPGEVELTIVQNLNNPHTYIAFEIQGNLYNFDFWSIDDVSLSAVGKKSDFDRDGRDDILWRYQGSGGANLIWFLGEIGAGDLSFGSDRLLVKALPLGGMELATRKAETIASSHQLKESIGEKRKLPGKGRDLAGEMNSRALRTKTVSDPRSMPRGADAQLQISVPSLGDPRDLKLQIPIQGTSGPGDKMSATGVLGLGALPSVGDLSWEIRGTGDFDNDGNADILWRYNGPGGENLVWCMAGTSVTEMASVPAVSDLGWQIVGTGDFNNDGQVDILWRHSSSGINLVWYMNGVNVTGMDVVSAVTDMSWDIVGTGDFNNDTHVDILWRNNGPSGINLVWYMDDVNVTGMALVASVTDPNWKIVGTGDFNSDTYVDILWRHDGAGGDNLIWYMDGVNVIGMTEITSVADANWKIVNR